MTMGLDVKAGGDTDTGTAAARAEMINMIFLKTAFDKVMALLAVITLSPLLVLIALAIKINGRLHPEDQGPVFYKEARVSQGRTFYLYKFRVIKSTVLKAARLERGYDHAKSMEGHEGSMTRVGSWLQHRYLDELPQLFNVLKGDMSLVGPRPWPVPMYEKEIARGIYRKRLLRPGLTGLVQAHKDEQAALGGGRALDEAYIEACRTLGPVRLLLFDLRVMADTFRILAKGQGL